MQQRRVSVLQIPQLIKNQNELYVWQCGSGYVLYIDNIITVSFDMYVWQCFKFYDIMNVVQNEDSYITYMFDNVNPV
jgi:hypothetical protein